MTTKCFDLYLNRSAAHFAIGNFKRCVSSCFPQLMHIDNVFFLAQVEDCSAAYDLLVPHVDLNLKARAQCLSRRGAALCKMGMIKQGYEEMLAAFKLTPSDTNLQADIDMIRTKLDQI